MLHRQFVFGQAMRAVVKDPLNNLQDNAELIDRLIYGWHNDAWSADRSYLAACIDCAVRSDGPILECDSGLSTVLIGALAKSQGRRHWALEHSPEWLARVSRCLDKYSIDSVSICLAPIRRYSDFEWYDAPIDEMPDNFALVVCDGPPGNTLGGRVGLLPVMRHALTQGCLILLDDAQRHGEQEVLSEWRTRFGVELLASSEEEQFMVLRIPDC